MRGLEFPKKFYLRRFCNTLSVICCCSEFVMVMEELPCERIEDLTVETNGGHPMHLSRSYRGWMPLRPTLQHIGHIIDVFN